LEKIELKIDQELKEECDKVDRYITKEWQHMYTSSPTEQFYKELEPEISAKNNFKDSNRM